ncbi:MAG: endonuclease/exonuclease/phosphatase family protein [Methanomicrobiales archaeon]
MKILTWNVAHQTHTANKNLPEMAEALASLSPDVIVLTEYVPGKLHTKFTSDLNALGFEWKISHASPTIRRQNQVLIASHTPLVEGDIIAPLISPAFPSNVLHVRVPEMGFEVLGLRVPMPLNPDIRSKYWNWIADTAPQLRDRPSIILGDLNNDTGAKGPNGGVRFNQLKEGGWYRAPASGKSYWSKDGAVESRLDHALFTPHFVIGKSEYITESGRSVFANIKPANFNPKAMSDHAILLVEFEIKPQ